MFHIGLPGEILINILLYRITMPWGWASSLDTMHPTKSNDGPILWMRPGEQSIPTGELGKSPSKRRRAGINELQNLKYLPRASIEREMLIEGM